VQLDTNLVSHIYISYLKWIIRIDIRILEFSSFRVEVNVEALKVKSRIKDLKWVIQIEIRIFEFSSLELK
jgi:hypothetical protein